MLSRLHRSRGFTLLEIMIVVVILSLLVGMLAPNVLGRLDEARVATAKSDINTLSQALELYRLDHREYPTTQQGLDALLSTPPKSRGSKGQSHRGYLQQSHMPKDPWEADYLYLSPGEHGPYDLYSLGADKQEGGEGHDADIGSWNIR